MAKRNWYAPLSAAPSCAFAPCPSTTSYTALRDHGASGGYVDDSFGGAGGAPDGCSQDLMVLAGGSGGGAGGPENAGGDGGGGGGAVQITSLTRIEIIGEPSTDEWSSDESFSGIAGGGGYIPITGIFANGRGGAPSRATSDGGGGGGGSGGAILLEAPSIEIRDAYLTANGSGGGGGSAALSALPSTAGHDGPRADRAAYGGAGESWGGEGGTGNSEPLPGQDNLASAGGSGTSAGGGGGSAGVIHLHVPDRWNRIEGSTFSPESSSHDPAWE